MKNTLNAMKVNAIIILHIAMFTMMSMILDKLFFLKTQEIWRTPFTGGTILVLYFISYLVMVDGGIKNQSSDMPSPKMVSDPQSPSITDLLTEIGVENVADAISAVRTMKNASLKN